MTAEIAILNRMGVALAADSAVTIGTKGGPKIYNTVNKLFALSKYEPVGIMIYGAAEFMTIPWEVVIKQYRSRLGQRRLPHLEDYVDSFLAFLSDSKNPLFHESLQEAYLAGYLTLVLSDVKDCIDRRVESVFESGNEITEDEVAEIVRESIEAKHSALSKADDLPETSASRARQILQTRKEVLRRVREEVFEKLPMSSKEIQRLRQVAALAIRKEQYQGGPYSGVVIAGFGEHEHYPSLYVYEVEGLIDGLLRYEKPERTVIGPEENAASIRPFAQGEMVDTFMQGLDPSYKDILAGFIHHVMDRMPKVLMDLPSCNLSEKGKRELVHQWQQESQELSDQFHNGLEMYAQQQFVQPVVELVASLPKDELAAMAEAFVNLTSFRRKVTPEAETVGGPIDVATITKGDGFIWIQRKHYFKPELNPHFFTNYYRDVTKGEHNGTAGKKSAKTG
jgi:hypothetical protein